MQWMTWGWSDFFQTQLNALMRPDLFPARIIEENRTVFIAQGQQGEVHCELSGKFKSPHLSRQERPVIGDWVLTRTPTIGSLGQSFALIEHILPRCSEIKRSSPGGAGEVQPLAANIDVALVVSSLNRDFNIRRLERYVTMIRDSGCQEVIVLSKVDLHPHPQSVRDEVHATLGELPIVFVSALTGEGVEDLKGYLSPGKTGVLLGSSGVGKSTLINSLLGESHQSVGAIRAADERGRHTTSRRSLFQLSNGAMIMDTPGLRELALAVDVHRVHSTFNEIEDLAEGCRFRDCTHSHEPGCAVLKALEQDELDVGRFTHFHKLRAEAEAYERRKGFRPSALGKKRGRIDSKAIRRLKKMRGDI